MGLETRLSPYVKAAYRVITAAATPLLAGELLYSFAFAKACVAVVCVGRARLFLLLRCWLSLKTPLACDSRKGFFLSCRLHAAHLLVRQAMGKESATRLCERWGHATKRRPHGESTNKHTNNCQKSGKCPVCLLSTSSNHSRRSSCLATRRVVGRRRRGRGNPAVQDENHLSLKASVWFVTTKN
jgi:hypothetical protein